MLVLNQTKQKFFIFLTAICLATILATDLHASGAKSREDDLYGGEDDPYYIHPQRWTRVPSSEYTESVETEGWRYSPRKNFKRAPASEEPVAMEKETIVTKHSHPAHLNDIPAEKALILLKNGNLRYTQNKMRKPTEGISEKDRVRLLAGQSPNAVVISCSDSRVPPEIVFDQRLGEIFVVRSAGETLDNAVLGSIEYAIEHLGAQLILVLGHDSCGAVTAAMNTMPNASSGSPYVDAMIADIQPRIASYFRRPASTGIVRESTANARGVVRDLIKRSAIVRRRVSNGTLQVRSALYHMDSGVVDFH